MCQMSGVMFHVSHVRCQVSHVKCHVSDFFWDKVVTQDFLKVSFFYATNISVWKFCTNKMGNKHNKFKKNYTKKVKHW